MKLWIDDVRPAPDDTYWSWTKSVNQAVVAIRIAETHWGGISLIDIDHDAGDYVSDGGDFINILNWLEKTGRNYPIRIHNMNPVGVENMRRIIKRNGWKEVF